MARFVTAKTLKPGNTPNDRRLLEANAAVTSAPTLATEGYAIGGAESIRVHCKGSSSPDHVLRFWWFSHTSEQWHSDESTDLTVGSGGDGDRVSKELFTLGNRFFVEVITYSSGSLDLWAEEVLPVTANL